MDKKLKSFLISCVKSRIEMWNGHIHYHTWNRGGDNKWDVANDLKQSKRQKTIAEKYLKQLEKIK